MLALKDFTRRQIGVGSLPDAKRSACSASSTAALCRSSKAAAALSVFCVILLLLDAFVTRDGRCSNPDRTRLEPFTSQTLTVSCKSPRMAAALSFLFDEALCRASKVAFLNAVCRTVFQRNRVGAGREVGPSGELRTAAIALDGRACSWKATLFLRAEDGRMAALDGRRCRPSVV